MTFIWIPTASGLLCWELEDSGLKTRQPQEEIVL